MLEFQVRGSIILRRLTMKLVGIFLKNIPAAAGFVTEK